MVKYVTKSVLCFIISCLGFLLSSTEAPTPAITLHSFEMSKNLVGEVRCVGRNKDCPTYENRTINVRSFCPPSVVNWLNYSMIFFFTFFHPRPSKLVPD